MQSETARTDQFHTMSKGQVPVHLFECFTDETFIKYHYDMSIFLSLKNKNPIHEKSFLSKSIKKMETMQLIFFY